MPLDSVTLEDALQLMSLPRVVGVDPESGDEITAQNGRYGPYLKKGTDSRTLPTEEAMFTVTLEEALEIYAQPKRGRGRTRGRRRCASSATTRSAAKPIVVKDGRFGAYVTDGETNATLRADDAVETVTAERAIELLAEKRARGPAKKRTTRARRPRSRRRRRRRPRRRPRRRHRPPRIAPVRRAGRFGDLPACLPA